MPDLPDYDQRAQIGAAARERILLGRKLRIWITNWPVDEGQRNFAAKDSRRRREKMRNRFAQRAFGLGVAAVPYGCGPDVGGIHEIDHHETLRRYRRA